MIYMTNRELWALTYGILIGVGATVMGFGLALWIAKW
jgi:hypothetical protein